MRMLLIDIPAMCIKDQLRSYILVNYTASYQMTDVSCMKLYIYI